MIKTHKALKESTENCFRRLKHIAPTIFSLFIVKMLVKWQSSSFRKGNKTLFEDDDQTTCIFLDHDLNICEVSKTMFLRF